MLFKGRFDLLKNYNLEQDRWGLDQRENFLVVQIGTRIEKGRLELDMGQLP